MISYYCNYCSAAFQTTDYSRRFCSRLCSNAALGLTRSRNKRPIRRQAELLACLRRYRGRFVALGTIAVALYGVDDRDARQAAYNAIARLRATWGAHGVRIETEGETVRYGWSAARYRLASDLRPDIAEVAV